MDTKGTSQKEQILDNIISSTPNTEYYHQTCIVADRCLILGRDQYTIKEEK